MENEKKGLAIAALVLGIIGVIISFIPIINSVCYILGILALIFGIISVVKKMGKGLAIAGIVLGVIALIITICMQVLTVKVIDNTINEINDIYTDDMNTILKNDLEATLGKFTATEDKYGIADTELKVTLKNKNPNSKSFSVEIEAKDKNGNRIDTDSVYASNLGSGQSQELKAFNVVTSDKVEALKDATFNIIKVSMY